MSLTNSPFWMATTDGGYSIDQSVRYGGRYTTANYFTRNHTQTRTKWTCSWWVKHTIDGNSHRQFESKDNNGASGNYAGFTFNSDGKFHMFDYTSGYRIRLTTSTTYKDPEVWYHFVLRFDSTQATASNRVRLYVNGVQVSWVTHTTYPAQNLSCQIGNGTTHYIGRYAYNANSAMQGYFAEWHMIDNQSLDASYFGEFKSGTWVPKEYTGTYGTNGFKLDFSNASALGTDSSGNGKNWTSQNMSSHDQVLDSPTNNFPVIDSVTGRSGQQFSEGGLVRYSDPSGYDHGSPTIVLPKSGKWYVEFMPHSQRASDPPGFAFGIAPTNSSLTSYPGGNSTDSYAISPSTGSTTVYNYKNGSWLGTSYNSGVTFTVASTVVQIAIDMDSGKFWFGFNNTFRNTSGTSANPSNGTNPSYTLTAAQLLKDMEVQAGRFTNDSGRWARVAWNFGQDGKFAGLKSGGTNTDANGQGHFQYTPPSGFLSLCSANLP